MTARAAPTQDKVRHRTLLREVNERIREVNEALGFDGEPGGFELLCECGLADCLERVEVTHSEYREIRRGEHNFLVMPGHERTGVDRVVAAGRGYHVVDVGLTAGAEPTTAHAKRERVRP